MTSNLAFWNLPRYYLQSDQSTLSFNKSTTMNTPENIIARQLNLSTSQVQNTLELLAEGGTVPFIARYRKERTGSLDEVNIAAIKEHQIKLIDFSKRQQVILESLEKNELLSPELETRLSRAKNVTELEDIYLPYRPKRKTRAGIAKNRGLTPLATHIIAQNGQKFNISSFIHSLKEPLSTDEAIAGAQDIIAELISEDEKSRHALRTHFRKNSHFSSKVIVKQKEKGEKYRDYFDWQEQAAKAPGHRVLAMFRAEAEKIVKLSIRPAPLDCLKILKTFHVKKSTPGQFHNDLIHAIEDSYQRLLAPSLENELRKELKSKADREAIDVFSKNLQQLLTAAPLGQKRVLAIDPGYRTGCKVVTLNEQGNLLDTCTIFPTMGDKQRTSSANTILDLIKQYRVEAIAIGNGTAGRETEQFIRSLPLDTSIIVTLVNEDGASIYSASEIGRAEFPDHDITVRGSVSIGRRLQDPLAELVKLDPKSIGVGQYQHDVNQTELKKALDLVVESSVNKVGVELNTASKDLLTYISGVGSTLAINIINHREINGPFSSLQQLKKVKRLGPKAFEQCAGFLRILNSNNPLDASAVHPERYKLVETMAKDLGTTVKILLTSDSHRKQIRIDNYMSDTVGIPTLNDILEELARPGRDPRETFEVFKFDETIQSINDLQENMRLPAIVTNITNFGAFADIGIKQDGLIHISQLADRFVKDPNEVVKIGQKVEAKVLTVDKARGRISLSLRSE